MKRAFAFGLAATLLAVTVPISAATFTVTNTASSDSGSLRQAILNANANPGPDSIDFAIPAPGVQTIVLASPLPAITQPVIIDGFTQPGSSANTQPVGQGLNAVLQVQIDGTGAVAEPCFQVFAGNDDLLVMAIQGLVINRCPVGAIHVGTGGDGALIAGNYIGTDPTGTSVPGPQAFGVRVVNVTQVAIGGTFAFERNLISGHTDAEVVAQTAAFMAIRGNLIGTNAAGNARVAEDLFADGLRLDVTASIVVGGLAAGARNVISGVGQNAVEVTNADASGAIIGNFIGTDVTGTQVIGGGRGIDVVDASPLIRDNVIAGQGGVGIQLEHSSSTLLGNFIGTDVTATLSMGNEGGGVYVLEENGDITIGGTAAGEGNVIAHNGRRVLTFVGGVHVRNPRTKIRGNRIFDNRYLGIDLIDGRRGGAVTPNDTGDLDDGANAKQNFPIIENVVVTAGATDVSGHLESTASTTFDIDFFAGASCSFFPWGPVQGEHYVGSLTVATDASGRVDFLTTVPYELPPGERMTATATDPQGRTSEFSQRIILSVDPRSGPAEGGTAVGITGMEFGPNTLLTVGGLPLTNVQVLDSTFLTGAMPALSPGTVYDVAATNPPLGADSLPSAWLSDFLDVPAGHALHQYVVSLVTNGISAGVGGGNFGIGAPTTRQQMAVFLLKAKHGSCYMPPPCAGIFPDVPCSSPFAPWVEQLAAEGITGGCGGGNFCPSTPCAAIRWRLSSSRRGPAPTSCRRRARACSPTSRAPRYSPTGSRSSRTRRSRRAAARTLLPPSAVTRGQMAVFVIKTFFDL